jgi:hypothetical protein
MSTPKDSRTKGQTFQVNDRVVKVGSNGQPKTDRFSGKILEAIPTTDSRGHKRFLYSIQWDDGRSSIHAQHIIRPLTEA